MLAIQLKSLNLQEEAQRKAGEEKNKASLLWAYAKSNEFFAETSDMGDILLEEDWETTENCKVSEGMRLLKDWQTQMNTIERKYRDFENAASKHKFSKDKIDAIDLEYERIRDKYEKIRDAVSLQDKERGLFTLEPAKTEKMKWPTFHGNSSEDFMKWYEKME